MEYRSHQQNTSGLQLTDHSLTNIACQGRYNDRRKNNNLNQKQMHHHHLNIIRHPWSPSQHTCRGWSSKCTRTCGIWLTSRQQIIGARCSWMTTSIITHYTSISRILTLTLGLLPSSLELLLHGLETDIFFKRRQVLQMLKELPKEMELPRHDLQNFVICLYFH